MPARWSARTTCRGWAAAPSLYSDGVTRDLGLLGGRGAARDAGAFDINEHGWIVGMSSSDTMAHAGFL